MNDNNEEMITISVNLPMSLVERIKKVSLYLDFSEDKIIQCGMQKYLDTYEEEWSGRFQGMEDIKKGNVYTQEESDQYFDEILEDLKLRKQQRQLLSVGS